MIRKTKIVCTLGPTSTDEKTLRQLLRAGMNVARLNFSHGDHPTHQKLYQRLRRLADEEQRPLAILQDLQGPKIRVTTLIEGEIELKTHQVVKLFYGEKAEANDEIPCSYPQIAEDIAIGDRILLDDGRLVLEATQKNPNIVIAKVIVGGVLSDHKGINLPGVKLSTPALTEKDREDAEFGKSLGVDYVALSFVRSAQDLLEARQIIDPQTHLIAKIEKPEALDAFDEILEVADGIMVARGDLGVEMGPKEVPILQKELIRKANAHSKLVITATEMLESMRKSPRPTRAEVSDVANAVLDGTDAVMLSGETAKGDYPIESVTMMSDIIARTESSEIYRKIKHPTTLRLNDICSAIASASAVAATEISAAAIITYTETGSTALMISEYRPTIPILAVSHQIKTYHQLAAHWGVYPILLERPLETAEEMVDQLMHIARSQGFVAESKIVIASGKKDKGPSDLMLIKKT